MKVVRTRDELQACRAGFSGAVGFVPTMGALHDGHVSLMRRSVADNPHSAVSIFVNPMQFGPGEDLERYPRTLEADLAMCRHAGVDAVFVPSADLMYPPGFRTSVEVEGLTDRLCGASRPGHFRGVATVVAKLFNLVRPDRAYFGQKDAQQVIVLRRMARDLDLGVEVVTCPIVREPDGLALSSRNRYLSTPERARAAALYRALQAAEDAHAKGETGTDNLRKLCRETLEAGLSPEDRVDYVELLDAEDLSPTQTTERPTLCAIAAWLGKTRLIDNTILQPKP
jgi:pantoate--beta-alanine ligase